MSPNLNAKQNDRLLMGASPPFVFFIIGLSNYQLQERKAAMAMGSMAHFILLAFFLVCSASLAVANQWCIAKTGANQDELQKALDWACSPSGGAADCSPLQAGQPCYTPNTVPDHASYAFNDYWQVHKKNGGTCDFGGVAMTTSVDPSHGLCVFKSF